MSTFYNEIDTYAAQWLRNLIAAGELPAGYVDERSIEEIDPKELHAYTSAHFFAGIGGWPLALRVAGWPDARPVWTASCPCQPLSSAGQRKGHADQRHLWPAFYRLIAECRPATVFGENVSGSLGREWFSAVRADLEECGYACGCADLAAASVGAPHIRQRLFWVAHADHQGQESGCTEPTGREKPGIGRGLANTSDAKRWPLDEHRENGRDGAHGGRSEAHGEPGTRGEVRWLDDSETDGQQHRSPDGRSDGQGDQQAKQGKLTGDRRLSVWSDIELIPCADGKTRVTQPGLRPLAHGVPNRVGRLRAYGNAIVPQVAAEFVSAYVAALD